MASDQKKLGNGKILIVDDVETNRLVLESIIEDMGCFPILAEDGRQALELTKSKMPQLILSDISMPGMDGYELCRTLKKDKKTKDIPIVFISAFDDPMDIVEGFLIGGEDYITKPFIPEVVQARVGVQLRLYEARQEMLEMNRRLQVSVNEQLAQMEQEKRNMLSALADMVLKNTGYPPEYAGRLRSNCRTLAQGMQLSPLYEDKISDTFIDAVELAAPLCDIGYMGVPTDILNKDKLTPDELEVFHSHTSIGAQLLADIYANNDYNEFISTAIDVVRHHHELWNGKGYPDGLKGDEVPLASQIVAIMTKYTILTGSENVNNDSALELMKTDAGASYSPDVYNICCKIVRQFC